MRKRIGLFTIMLAASLGCTAQNNAIFTGGPGDGWASDNYGQPDNNIFTGGSGDGWASESYGQPDNNIFTGGTGDGWATSLTISTAVEENVLGSAAHAYPNPTSGLLNIDLAGEWGPVTIEVLSASGQLVRSERYASTGTMVIDVPGASGQYLVRLSTGTGEQTTFRILKR